ncbi:hypothetical protein LS68_009165 [Helicobacter sp. MIT 05-5293]|uniref:terminase large subunit domain-containing protein n=1 Tax=unclassified Helicobacter TaxID=2593540 RepID=UPI00051D7781|nr:MULTISPECIES: terminase family protein [unclassified Helicobacter]TLD79832.1 hypothetical protein LS68_009165 [Helicobacter sp. MIT 05-5293]TLD85451.1 hypothetical protein LS69_009470 [Helicobacter sp. MIT 05-5294]
MDKETIQKELATRALAKKSLKHFVLLKWERYEKKPFMDNWHYDYLCKVLENTLPCNTENLGFIPERQTITRLMINMPPSYGKTEIIARCFIAWALGNYPQRKFFYISYSDELCRKISNQVRDLLKSRFFASVFGKNPQFLQDNANEFIFKEGGGLFVTTLKSALTGFHAHQILIDDPIKVSAMTSRSERNLVNQNFKESVMSRLQDNQSNITILMQRLGDEDLCGFLLSEKNFERSIIEQWQQISLKALNDKEESYSIGEYSYQRAAHTALFPLRHTKEELERLRLQMGNDEFSTQYQQDPQVSEAGYFEKVYFKTIPSYECSAQNLYIFVDNAMSLNANADNRALVLIGVESYQEAVRYVVRDCLCGIWSEEETLKELISLMYDNPTAKVYIESEGGGLTLERLLENEIVRFNFNAKSSGKNAIINSVKCYTPSRKISKVEKIKAIRPYYNTGFLVFLHNARGLKQIKKELFSFNPAKPFRKDDCIDAIASAMMHDEVIPIRGAKKQGVQGRRLSRPAWNI